jgi:hypothetical protein
LIFKTIWLILWVRHSKLLGRSKLRCGMVDG